MTIGRLDALFSAALLAGSVVCAADHAAPPGAHDSVAAPAMQAAAPATTAAAATVGTRAAPNGVGGPFIVVDSSAREPKLALEGSAFVLHLPVAMARVLNDSLPGMTPIPRAAFDTGVVSFVDHGSPEEAPGNPGDMPSVKPQPLSVVVGDFDGDSAVDVTIMGRKGDTTATFFLMSPSSAQPSVRLLYIDRPSKDSSLEPDWVYIELVRPGKVTAFSEEDSEPPTFQLKHGAVTQVFFGKAAQVCYVEHGVVKKIVTDD